MAFEQLLENHGKFSDSGRIIVKISMLFYIIIEIICSLADTKFFFLC